MSIIVLLLALCAAALVYFTTVVSRKRSRLPLPPGPEGNWDFGRSTTSFACVFILKAEHEADERSFSSFQELETLFQEYGPVVTLKSGSQTVVVIGRQEAAIDIMEKEGASLAERPKWVAASEIVSGGMRILLLNSGKRFRKLRKLVSKVYNASLLTFHFSVTLERCIPICRPRQWSIMSHSRCATQRTSFWTLSRILIVMRAMPDGEWLSWSCVYDEPTISLCPP